MKLKNKMRYLLFMFILIAIPLVGIFPVHKARASHDSVIGVLVIGHGFFSENPKFFALVDEVQNRLPSHHVEIAMLMYMDFSTFEMWQTVDEAIRRLEAKGVKKIICVPMFLNTFSSTVQAIKWSIGCPIPGDHSKSDFMGEIIECPSEYDSINDFCKFMGSIHHRYQSFSDIEYIATDALDYHPSVSPVLLERAREFSTDPANEVVILVGHGYGDDTVDADYRSEVLARYSADIQTLGGGFADVQFGTIREDWCPERLAAVQDIRDKINNAAAAGKKVIWVPVRISSWSDAHDEEWDPDNLDCNDPDTFNRLGTKDLLDEGKYVRANFMLWNPLSLADWVVDKVNEAKADDVYIDCN